MGSVHLNGLNIGMMERVKLSEFGAHFPTMLACVDILTLRDVPKSSELI